MKKTLAVILILAIILSFCSCSVIQRKYPPAKDNGNIDMNTWSESIERAESLENSVISKYSNADRDEYFIKNKTFELKHKLGSDSTVSFLSDSGNVYFEDSLNLYIKDENGIYYSDNPNSAARMNTYRMGFYYTDIHMLDMQTKFNDKTVYFEKIFHTYADKLHTEYRFVSDSIVSGIDEYGTEIKIPTENVNAVYFTDSSGEHNDLSDLKENTAVSFALDVKDTGVIGFILSDGENIYVNEENGFYAVRHYKKAENSDIIRGEPLSLSCRLYNDKSHSFEGFKQAIAEEKTFPDISIFKQVDGARILGYNSKNGAYEIRMDGIDFNSAYHTYPNYHFKANIEVNNNTFDRNIYIRCISYTGHLESSVLLDENELLLPISVEVNKNFNGEFEEPIYDPYDTAYGEAVFPLQIKNDETRKFTLVQLYQNWGNYPLKQFSSIQFIAPYYHQSCGVTETNCISPYYIFGKDGWILPDFRAMSATMWPSQPQHYTYGRLYAASLTDPDNPNNLFPEFQKTDILNSGPAYIDAYTYYSFENNGVDVKYRHAEHPQTDENRTMYSMVISFSKDLSVEDAKINFALFSTDGRITNYKNIGYLNENNQTSYERCV